jgi:hypothetical protein
MAPPPLPLLPKLPSSDTPYDMSQHGMGGMGSMGVNHHSAMGPMGSMPHGTVGGHGHVGVPFPLHATVDEGGRTRHVCPSCPKEFAKPSALKRHIRSHTGEKLFNCTYPKCDVAFAERGNLKASAARKRRQLTAP